MSRLSHLQPAIGSLAPRLARATDNHGHSRTAEPWRKWYSTAAWQALRLATFDRDGYRCQWKDCGRLAPAPRLVADHRTPHRGDPRLFWDPENLQTLCKPCHDTRKQAAERRAHG
jgi:5-methylcytosine-specific restriction protein A